uniref:Uncharacterized protein n=1 Tax=Anguilla anguilla TaxID=7936 RepID=A0A0E9VBP7_ANGAN
MLLVNGYTTFFHRLKALNISSEMTISNTLQ